jgi:hypothetical protein
MQGWTDHSGEKNGSLALIPLSGDINNEGPRPSTERRTAQMFVSTKRYFIVIITSLLVSKVGHAQGMQMHAVSMGTSPEITVLRSDDRRTVLEIDIPGFELDKEISAGDTICTVHIPSRPGRHHSGTPEVPIISRLVALPGDREIDLSIVASEYRRFPKVTLALDQRDALSTIQQAQSQKNFAAEGMATLGRPGVLRDFRVAPLSVFPVQYSDDRNELLVYSRIRLELVYSGASSDRKEETSRRLAASFEEIYTNLILNYDSLGLSGSEYQRGGFLIITHDAFYDHIQPLAEWKRRQGWFTGVVKLSDIGPNPSASRIREYILGVYTSWDVPLEYVLLVGDTHMQGIGQFPSFYKQTPGGGDSDVTDHPYSLMEGDDYFPDLFVGRLSVDTVNDVIVVINKILSYEREPYMGQTNWYRRALLVAGNYSETPPIPTTPRLTSLWLMEKMLANGYFEIDTVFYPPATGPQLISASIDRGVGFVNYRGWGDANGWHYPNFKVDDILSLNNGLMLPVMTSIVCNSGDFDNQIVDPCFGEVWLRAGTPMRPKGGVAFFGPSDLYTSTKYNNAIDAGMYWGLFDEGLSSLGAVALRGKLELFNGFPTVTGPDDWVEFYFHVYNILGDPSLEMWTDCPQALTVSHPSDMSTGQHSIEVTVKKGGSEPVERASVCLFKDDEVFAHGFTDESGALSLSVVPTTAGTLFATVTARNAIPYEGFTAIVASDGSIGYARHDIDDRQGGNNDGRANRGETVLLPVTVTNYGTAHVAIAVSGTLKTEDPLVTVTDPVATFGQISPGESSTSADGFEIVIDPSCPHGRRVHFQLIVEDAMNLHVSAFDVAVSGPDLIYMSHRVDDGSGNGLLDPGETANLSVTISNDGWEDITGLSGTLICWNDAASILDSQGAFPDIPKSATGENEIDPFTLSVSSSAAVGRFIAFAIALTGDNDFSDTTSFSLTLGEVTSTAPLGPDDYGYYAYDNTDIAYSERPTYNWIEIDPDYGGQGTKVGMGDDDEMVLELPFSFRYYGLDYDEITVCSNGWMAVGETWMNDFRNWGIPAALGPYGMIAPFWDDLDSTLVSETVRDEVHVCYLHQPDEHRFVVEWSRVLNHYDSSLEIVQAILYDPEGHRTGTGDGEIVFQYHTVNNVDTRGNYATVGIESPTQADGLEYTFANRYPPAAAPLASGLAVKFTTDPPDTFQTDIEDGDWGYGPSEYALSQNYPNPFNPSTEIRYQIVAPSLAGDRVEKRDCPVQTTLKIFNILGQEVKILVDEVKEAGEYAATWDGRDNQGRSVETGVYFYRLTWGEKRATRRMLLVK